jgi:hypothetical protein
MPLAGLRTALFGLLGVGSMALPGWGRRSRKRRPSRLRCDVPRLVVVIVALAMTGCGSERPFTVDVEPDAAAAAREAGVDLESLVTRSADEAFERLPHRGVVRIHVTADATEAIPGIGVGGFSGRDGNPQIAIDVNRGALHKALETWIPLTVAHELDHSSRIRTGPGYGKTLGEAIVSEGLADHFAAEVFPDAPKAPWDDAVTKDQERESWLRARRSLWSRFGYDHAEWFFGAGSFPHWVGYTLGYDIVGAYLDRKDVSAADAVDVNARNIIEPFRGF